MSLSASADDSIRTWIPDQWAQLFPVVQGYYLGADLQYHDCEFRYYGGAAPVTIEDTISSGDVSMLGRTCVNYRAYLPDSNVPIQAYYNEAALYEAKFIMNFDFTFLDCSYCSIGFFGYIYPNSEFSSYYSSQPLLYSYAESNQWYNSASDIISSTNAIGGMRGLGWSGSRYNGLGGISSLSQSPNNLHFGTLSIATVGSNTASDGSFFGVVLPITNQDATIVLGNPDSGGDDVDWGDADTVGEMTGTIEDNGDGSQNINVTVNTDNSGFLSGILNGIKRIFIPSDDFLNGWHDDIQDSFEEHLGGVAEAVTLIDEQADYLRAATSADYIYFPELTLPIGSTGSSGGVETLGADYTLIQGQQVELRPARTGKLKILWDFVEFAVDVVCVLAVFNMLQTKYEIFLNPDGEVISYDF